MPRLCGSCTGGLSCDGGCCRHIIMNMGQLIEETYCQHYDNIHGTCKIYENREEMGFGGCITFPTLGYAINNPLPKGCGYYLSDDTD